MGGPPPALPVPLYRQPYSAWLNLVERFFGLLTEHALKRGSHSSTHALRHAISAYVDAHNDEGKPFKWTKTADEILAKVKRFGQRTVQVHGWPQMTNDFLKKSKIKGTRAAQRKRFEELVAEAERALAALRAELFGDCDSGESGEPQGNAERQSGRNE